MNEVIEAQKSIVFFQGYTASKEQSQSQTWMPSETVAENHCGRPRGTQAAPLSTQKGLLTITIAEENRLFICLKDSEERMGKEKVVARLV